MKHIPVLYDEVLEYLDPKPGGLYIDGTVGYGGHASLILEACKGSCTLIGSDRDQQALSHTKERLSSYDSVDLFHGSYAELPKYLDKQGINELDGVLLDLGASSPQFDEGERGFSFSVDGPLDMRFDLSSSKTAAEILNTYPEKDLANILYKYGEEKASRKIAKAIVEQRKVQPFERTSELVFLLEELIGAQYRRAKIHPATRTFQALRIETNDELKQVEEALPQFIARLKKGGRIAVISFHSLEDRIVKDAFKFAAKECICPKEFPVCRCDKSSMVKILTKKPITATKTEINKNVRSRSAKLRVAERI